jgi:hypothetical protein
MRTDRPSWGETATQLTRATTWIARRHPLPVFADEVLQPLLHGPGANFPAPVGVGVDSRKALSTNLPVAIQDMRIAAVIRPAFDTS